MKSLTTKSQYLRTLSTGQDCELFLRRAKSVRSLDLIAEGVLRNNNIKVNLTNWEIALKDAEAKELPEIVLLFIKAAAQRWLALTIPSAKFII